MQFPSQLSINAYTGHEAASTSPVSAAVKNWGIRDRVPRVPRLLDAPAPVDLRRWEEEEVGWGLVLPENEEIPNAERALAKDAPEPIQELLTARSNAPVFRYRLGATSFLRRYMTDGTAHDLLISSASRRGVAPGRLPWYLLIYATPAQIPWRIQYLLNQSCFVGRVDLDGTALENYVNALLDNWNEMESNADRPLVWTVDHGATDITRLMRKVIADPVAKKLMSDTDFGNKATRLAGPDSTVDRLRAVLAEKQPALVVTTSHGMTGPLDDPDRMAAQLGLLVDKDHALLRPDALLEKWQPSGAIWYAHACCSAGSDHESSYVGLLEEDSSLDQTLRAIADLDSQVAPLPRELLGAAKPLRAFVGHVEPTFDWTLEQPLTGQKLTNTITEALYNHLYQSDREPVGLAFRDCFRHVGELLALWEEALNDVASTDAAVREAARRLALIHQLTAFDRRSMVILGDPTSCIPMLVQ
jgi:hypothetical protein